VVIDSTTSLEGKSILRFGLGMSRIAANDKDQEKQIDSRLEVLHTMTQKHRVLVDTSPIYGNGLSEKILKQPLSTSRDKIFLATKYYPQDHHNGSDVVESVSKSLERMSIENIDLLQIHFPNPLCNFKLIVDALQELLSNGTVKNIGLSNFSRQEVKELENNFPELVFKTNQIELSLSNLGKTDSSSWGNDSRVLTYGSLLQGRLAHKKIHRIMLEKIAEGVGLSPAALTILLILQKKPEVIPILRISKQKNLEDIMKIFAVDHDESNRFENIVEFEEQIQYVSPDRIRLRGDSFRQPYSKLEDALVNPLELFPSPTSFAVRILKYNLDFPIKVKEVGNGFFEIDDSDPFDQVKKYWAYRIAKPNENIPIMMIDG